MNSIAQIGKQETQLSETALQNRGHDLKQHDQRTRQPDKNKIETHTMKSTNDIIDHHLKAFADRDLNGVLSDYAPDVTFFTQRGPLRGVEAIRPLFQALITEFAKPGAKFSLERQAVEGDHGYILWTAETADNVYDLGTDTFTVQDGKIVAQSFTGVIRPKA